MKHQVESDKLRKISSELRKQIDNLSKEKEDAVTVNSRIRQQAAEARDCFVADIAQVLSESRNTMNLRNKIKELQRKVQVVETQDAELKELRKKIKDLEKVGSSGKGTGVVAVTPAPRKRVRKFLIHLDDPLLLAVFSFLETKDVIWAAQTCRYVFKRVDTLFGIESQIVRPEWGQEPIYPTVPSTAQAPTSSGSQSAGGSVGLTKTMAEALSAKLSAPELKTIIAMSEQQRKSNAHIEQLTAENEDLKARLDSTESVRDFLIGKLKDAELAIKTAMSEKAVLKKQSATDHEVIFFLDNHTQELESSRDQLKRKCEQLEASLDLVQNSNSHKERQLTMEVRELTDKCEMNDANYKSQKKILVKEVKTLRTQLEALKDERDMYQKQLQVMRDALSGNFPTSTTEQRSSSSNSEARLKSSSKRF